MSELAAVDRRCPNLPTAEHLHGHLQETLPQRPSQVPDQQLSGQPAPRPRPNRVCKVGEGHRTGPLPRSGWTDFLGQTRSRWKPRADIDVKTAAAAASTATGLLDTTRICNSGMAHHMSPKVHSAAFSRLATCNSIYFNDHGSQM
jgi:hypothetical protein